jgi:hypothetical protein
MRGIVGKTDEDDKDTEAQKKLCEILNKAASKWPTTLVGRSKRCVRVTEDAIAAGCFRNFQISAVTKFMWFLKPDNWTSFDQYAAKGYNKFAPRGSKLPTIDTESKMIAFYKGLKDRQVTSIWSVMQEVIDKGRLKGLPAPRIFDSFLMEKGRREEAIQSNRIARYSLALLPKQTARDIHRLGSELQSKFGSQIEVAMTSKIQ